MNTPAHLIFGAAAFGKADKPGVTAAALLGALVPDLSLYLLVGWSLWALGIPAQVVFGELYFSETWQNIFAVDNSIPLWAALFGLALWRRWPVGIAFAGAGLLHLAFDFPLHNDDARRHFWPLSDFVFHSPVSYWDRHHHGQIAAPVEMLVCLGLLVVLWRRFQGWKSRARIAALGVLELAPGIMFALMFSARQ